MEGTSEHPWTSNNHPGLRTHKLDKEPKNRHMWRCRGHSFECQYRHSLTFSHTKLDRGCRVSF